MLSFKSPRLGAFMEKVVRRSSITGKPYEYNIIYDHRNTSQDYVKIAVFMAFEQSRYDREVLHGQMADVERRLSLQGKNVIFCVYAISHNAPRAYEILSSALIEHKDLYLAVPIGDYPARVLADICDSLGRDQPILFVDVINPLVAGMVDAFGEPFENRTGVMKIRPAYQQLTEFLSSQKPDLKHILVLHDSHYAIRKTPERVTIGQALTDTRFSVEHHVMSGEMDTTAELFKKISDFQGIVLDHDATIGRRDIEQLVELCNTTGTLLITTDATGVYLGAGVGIGNTGYAQGNALVPKILEYSQGKPLSKIPITDLADNENISFNPGTKCKQGLFCDRSTDAALRAKSIEEVYFEYQQLKG